MADRAGGRGIFAFYARTWPQIPTEALHVHSGASGRRRDMAGIFRQFPASPQQTLRVGNTLGLSFGASLGGLFGPPAQPI